MRVRTSRHALQSQVPSSMVSTSSNNNKGSTALACLVAVCVGFYAGNMWGMHNGFVHGSVGHHREIQINRDNQERLIKELESTREKLKQAQDKCSTADTITMDRTRRRGAGAIGKEDPPRFPPEVSSFATGMALLDRDAFATKFDTGVPLDKTKDTNSRVLLLYSQALSLPKNRTLAHDVRKLNSPVPTVSSIEDATQNCDFLNIVLTDFAPRRAQCIAVMGQYEAYHIQKFARLDEYGSPLNRTLPLRYVNRGAQASGRKSTKPPRKDMTLSYWATLSQYLAQLPKKLESLADVAKQAAGRRNTVIVMVCNHGQSELLLNFVCAAKSRNLESSLQHILLFATDVETRDLATSLGLKVVYDPETFGEMPKEAAMRYADPRFTKMMMAKVYCVQMVVMMGYDILFQDVDIVWYKDPLTFFENRKDPMYNYDVYFQDDGNHALYYGPYSANTGFYYVRNSDKTRFFFNAMLLSGDLILSTHSHQVALIAQLNEHASMYGLKVKILSRDTDTHPGGYHYHNRRPFMKDFFAGKVSPYIFHMSWTASKVNKLKFFMQLGEWFVKDTCVGKTLQEVGGAVLPCCLPEPNITCHYKDKPSKIRCDDSPNIDRGRRPFWP